jgi:hypothetical protein
VTSAATPSSLSAIRSMCAQPTSSLSDHRLSYRSAVVSPRASIIASPEHPSPASARIPPVANSSSLPRAINATATALLAVQMPATTGKLALLDTTLTPLRSHHPATTGNGEQGEFPK